MAVADRIVCNADAGSEERLLQIETPGPKPMFQALIDALIDIDIAFERECRELSRGTVDAAFQDRMLTKLREQHQQRRDPYVQQLFAQHEDLRTRGRSSGQSISIG
jgi:hypothetical protein